MKNWLANRYFKLALSIMGGLCGAGLFIFLLFNIFNMYDKAKEIVTILIPIIMGAVFAYLLSPIQTFVEDHIVIPLCQKIKIWKKPVLKSTGIRLTSTIFTILFFCLMLYVLLRIVIPELVNSMTQLINNIPVYIEEMNKWVDKLLRDNEYLASVVRQYIDVSGESFEAWVSEKVLTRGGYIVKLLSTKVFNLLSVLLNIIIAVIVSVYILVAKENFIAQSKKCLFALVKKETAENVIKEVKFIDKTFGHFITGKITDSVIIGLICFIICTCMRMPYTPLVSVIVGITNVIPVVGPFLGGIPCALLILLVDPKRCLWFIVMIIILQQVDGNIIGPKILGESTGISPFWVLFSITLFGGLFGILGMFIGVPLFAVIYDVFKRIIINKLKKRNLPTETEAYLKKE